MVVESARVAFREVVGAWRAPKNGVRTGARPGAVYEIAQGMFALIQSHAA